MGILISSNNESFFRDNALPALAVETSGRTGSVALGIGSRLMTQKTLSGFQKHSSELLPVIKTLLQEHRLNVQNLKHIYLAVGPGSFTGIRISVSFAKMAAFASGCKIISVNTHDALAENATQIIDSFTPNQVLATILDAKKGLFYIAIFRKDKKQFCRISDDLLTSSSDFLEKVCPHRQVVLLGEGLLYHKKAFEHSNVTISDDSLWPAQASSVWTVAQRLAQTNQFDDPAALVPNYIRKPEAEENLKKQTET